MAGESQNIRERSRRLALCGLMSALGAAFLMGAALPFAVYCGPILAMLTLLPVQDAYGGRWALGVYGVESLLGLLLSAELEAALLYLFLGYYPVLRHAANRLPGRVARLSVKLAAFNAALSLTCAAAIFLFRLPGAKEEILGASLPGLLTLLGLGNGTFLLLDQALGRLETLYRRRWKRRLFPGGR